MEEKYHLVYLNVVSGNVAVPTATMQISIDGETVQDAGFGVGPVDATFAAIRKITGTDYPLMKYAVDAVTGGTDAQGQAMVQLIFNGISSSPGATRTSRGLAKGISTPDRLGGSRKRAADPP